jgi:putative flippase GtrA
MIHPSQVERAVINESVSNSPPLEGGVGKAREPLTKKNQALSKLRAGFSILSLKGRGCSCWRSLASLCKERVKKSTAMRFMKFGFIGAVGFCVDSAVLLFGTNILNLDPYSARVISYIIAATTTWIGNRWLTFADRPKARVGKQWLLFLVVNGPGMLVNNSVYALLVSQFPYVYAHPVWAVAAGSLAGMVFNYIASSRFVFPSR